MPYPLSLPTLSQTEAVADALYRACRGFDTNDRTIFHSAWAGQDVSFTMDGKEYKGLDAIVSDVLDLVGPLATTHFVSNIRVSVEPGSSTASLNAYGMNQHCAPGKGLDPSAPKFMSGSTYDLALIKSKEDGLWKIKTWDMTIVWLQGDASVMGSAKKD